MSALQNLAELKNEMFVELLHVDLKPYSHNIVGLYLRQLNDKYGEKEVINVMEAWSKFWARAGWSHYLDKYNIEYDKDEREKWMEEVRQRLDGTYYEDESEEEYSDDEDENQN